MSNEQESCYLNGQDLDELLRMLALEDGAHPAVPPQLVDDYIHGRASAEGQQRIESAMARSSAIREEVLALAAIAKRGAEFDALRPPRAPRRRGQNAVVGVAQHPSWIRRRTPLMAFCGLLALALAVWLLGPLTPNPFTKSPTLYAVSFDRTLTDEQFETDVLRAPGPGQTLPDARNARDAALLSFFQAVEWKDGDFIIHTVPPASDGERTYHLALELERDGKPATWPYEVRLPKDAKEPRTAILVLPDLTLHWVKSSEWNGRVSFAQDPGQRLFLTVTYRVGSAHRASAPTMVPPP